MSYSHCQCMENSSLLSYIHCIYSSLFLQCEAQHNLIFEAKSKEKIDIAFLQCYILLLHQRGFGDSMETHKNAHMKMITTIHGKVGCKNNTNIYHHNNLSLAPLYNPFIYTSSQHRCVIESTVPTVTFFTSSLGMSLSPKFFQNGCFLMDPTLLMIDLMLLLICLLLVVGFYPASTWVPSED